MDIRGSGNREHTVLPYFLIKESLKLEAQVSNENRLKILALVEQVFFLLSQQYTPTQLLGIFGAILQVHQCLKCHHRCSIFNNLPCVFPMLTYISCMDFLRSKTFVHEIHGTRNTGASAIWFEGPMFALQLILKLERISF